MRRGVGTARRLTPPLVNSNKHGGVGSEQWRSPTVVLAEQIDPESPHTEVRGTAWSRLIHSPPNRTA